MDTFTASEKIWGIGRDMMMISTLLDVPATMCVRMSDAQRIRFQECYQLEKKYNRPFHIGNSDIITSFKNNPVMRLIHQRVVEWGNAEITTPVALFLAAISTSRNTMKAVMWSYTVVFLYHQTGSIITMHDLSNTFQFGFPNDAAINMIWTAQKDNTATNGNRLDDSKNWDLSSGSVSDEVAAALV